MLMYLEEITIVGDRVNHVFNVVREHGIGGDDRIERRIRSRDRVRSRAARGIVQIVEWQKTHQFADHGQAFGVVSRDEMSYAAGRIVRHGSAQILFGNILVRNRLDHVRAGDKHVRSVPRHENKIGDGRRIHGAPRARAHDGADLRDHSARQRVAQKNIGITRERPHAFLNAGSPGIIQADYGRAVAHRQVHDLADFECIRLRERSTEYGEILREHVNQSPIHASKTRDKAVARRPLLLHPKIIATMGNEFIELLKRAFVEQQFDALARRELAGFVLAFAAIRAATRFRFGIAAAQFC